MTTTNEKITCGKAGWYLSARPRWARISRHSPCARLGTRRSTEDGMSEK